MDFTTGAFFLRIVSVLVTVVAPAFVATTLMTVPTGSACLMNVFRLTLPDAFFFVKPLPFRPFGQRLPLQVTTTVVPAGRSRSTSDENFVALLVAELNPNVNRNSALATGVEPPPPGAGPGPGLTMTGGAGGHPPSAATAGHASALSGTPSPSPSGSGCGRAGQPDSVPASAGQASTSSTIPSLSKSAVPPAGVVPGAFAVFSAPIEIPLGERAPAPTVIPPSPAAPARSAV